MRSTGLDFRATREQLCGKDSPIGVTLRLSYDGEEARGEFTPGELHQSAGNMVHRGILWILLDEITGGAVRCCGVDSVTVESRVRFRRPAWVGEPIHLSARVTRMTRRLIEADGVLARKDGTVIAEGSLLFHILRKSQKAVLWDIDGVIADSASLYFSAWQEAFARVKARYTRDDFTRLFGSRDDYTVRGIVGERVAQEEIDRIIKDKEAHFRARAKGNIKPFKGAVGLLDSIRKGNFRTGLVSSAPREDIDLVLGELGVADRFDCIVSGQEVAESKPNPRIYLLAAERLGVEEPRNCIVIEDSALGVRAAKAAGMRCLAVTNTHPRQALGEADRVVDSLEELDLLQLITQV